MKLFANYSLKLILPALFVLMVVTANAQDARLRFENLSKLEDKAMEVVEINIDGKLLDLAKRVLMKMKDQDAQKVGQAIAGLKGIYVRVYNFEKDNEYNIADVDEIRAQLQSPGWEKLANARSKKNNQKIDIYTMFTGDTMSGVAVVVSENKSIAVVNVIGPIDIDLLAELSGKINIPKLEIQRDNDNQEKPKN